MIIQVEWFILALAILFFCAIFSSSLMLKNTNNWRRRKHIVSQYSTYEDILEKRSNEAFNIVYKDRIAAFSASAYRVNDEDLDGICKEFIQVTLKLLGTNLTEDFILLFGDVSTLFYWLSQKFDVLYENDNLREIALAEITEKENQLGDIDYNGSTY